ncbi:MAG: hypothetical protein EOO60_11120 [Hymenobacter sp.]|nr:MAG: hypothetical protein EOO60_11120 [Hymenobacter sp.]
MFSFDYLKKQSVITPADNEYLLTHKLADGKGFPPSYIAFATQLGWGRLGGLFLIYVPMKQYADSWLIQSPRIKHFMNEFYVEMEGDPFLVEPDGYLGIEQALLPFGMSENGEYLAWDTNHRGATDEMPIYVLAARFGGIRYGAADLYQFIEKCTDNTAVKSALGPGYAALPRTFEPLPELGS